MVIANLSKGSLLQLIHILAMAQQIVVQATGKNGKLTENFEDNLQITKAPVPAPKDGEVLVRVLYR